MANIGKLFQIMWLVGKEGDGALLLTVEVDALLVAADQQGVVDRHGVARRHELAAQQVTEIGSCPSPG